MRCLEDTRLTMAMAMCEGISMELMCIDPRDMTCWFGIHTSVGTHWTWRVT